MMHPNKRARRLSRNNVKKAGAGLNLVSLMDIFTILVFFLLVNSSSAPQPNNDGLKLPEAKVEKPVAETLQIQVTKNTIIVQDRPIVTLTEALINSDEELIGPLVDELKYQMNRAQRSQPDNAEENHVATLMADRELPFKLLKKIMLSAAEAEYSQLALAVISLPQDSD